MPGAQRARSVRRTLRLLFAVLTICLVGVMPAQRPSVAPTRFPDDANIVVDGALDEPAWRDALRLDVLTETEPVEGRAPEVGTIVRIAYDRDFVYLAMECEERPGLLRSRLMQRDANLDPDDRIEWWIDSFGAQRFGYWFQIGAGGSQGDALLSEAGTSFNKQWDGIWYGRTRLNDRGWQAEVAIPFQTIGFDRAAPRWGFNVRRLRSAVGTDYRWASPRVAYRFFDLRVGGWLTGMQELRQGLGISAVPYVRFNASRDRRVSKHTSRTGDFGMDLGYRITPSLGLLLTYNTDFAETEVDDRQVNLTRFPLFFPEKRDFFLQDSDLFEFGFSGGFGGGSSPLPFFSRRIGLSDSGGIVPLIGGLRLSGRVAGWNIGALGTLMDESAADPEKGLGVVRVSRNISSQSAVGIIATGGRPTGRGDAATVGADLRLSDSELLGAGGSGTLWVYGLTTQAPGTSGDGEAVGMRGQIRTAQWEHRATAEHIEPEFDPQLGFVRRTGIRRYQWDSSFTRRSGGVLQEFELGSSPQLTTTDSNGDDSWSLPLELDIRFQSQDRIGVEARRRFERVPSAFEINDGVFVSAGEYYETRFEAFASAADNRVLGGSVSVEWGDLFSGDLLRWSVRPSFIPNRYLQISAEYQEFIVNLNEGDFTTRVAEGRVDVTPSPDLAWRNLVQWDTNSRDLTFQSRLRWIREPGQDLFLVALFGWNSAAPGAPLIPTTQDFTLKAEYTIRF
ncbi:MAG: DUF5916 domain-containing protein [Planctomycetota bacterium]